MTIGALIDAGVPFAAVERGLEPLGLKGYRLELGERIRSGITARKFSVHVDSDPSHPHDHGTGTAPEHGHGGSGAHPHRHYAEIRELLSRSALSPGVRSRAQRIFHALAVSEGRIHGVPTDDVAFHEVGAIDAIVDIVGTAICLEHLEVGEIYTSLAARERLQRSSHGVIPSLPPRRSISSADFDRPDDGAIEPSRRPRSCRRSRRRPRPPRWFRKPSDTAPATASSRTVPTCSESSSAGAKGRSATPTRTHPPDLLISHATRWPCSRPTSTT